MKKYKANLNWQPTFPQRQNFDNCEIVENNGMYAIAYVSYCNECGCVILSNTQSSRRIYCSNYCRVRAYRKRHGIPEPIFANRNRNVTHQ